MKHYITVWVFTKEGGVDSIGKESTVREILAERYPERIYFFAELVPPFEPDEQK